jgi:peptidoglycan-N-acetylglucosamine deacetylase
MAIFRIEALGMVNILAWATLCGIVPVILYFGLPLLFKHILRAKLQRYISSSNSIVLTFDDGPDLEATPKILDTLKLHQIRAVFFVVAEKAAICPDVIRRIVSEGHIVGEHGYAHMHAWTTLPHVYLHDLLAGRRTIEAIIGRQRRGFIRPSYGKLNILTILYCWLGQRQSIFWTVDPKDYQSSSYEDVCSRTVAELESTKGGVVLLHDGRRRAEHNSVEITVSVVRELCENLTKGPLRFETLDEVLKNRVSHE